jgi:hypothetical protein
MGVVERDGSFAGAGVCVRFRCAAEFGMVKVSGIVAGMIGCVRERTVQFGTQVVPRKFKAGAVM